MRGQNWTWRSGEADHMSKHDNRLAKLSVLWAREHGEVRVSKDFASAVDEVSKAVLERLILCEELVVKYLEVVDFFLDI
jgi:hypothetical protein